MVRLWAALCNLYKFILNERFLAKINGKYV